MKMKWLIGVYMLLVNFISGFNFPLFQTHYTLPYPKTKEKKRQTALMSRIDLVSKNLLANGFRNCRKRSNWEKLCKKITYKYRKNRKITNLTRIKTWKKRHQEGPRNVRKYRKSNKEFSYCLKTPVKNIAKIAKITNLKRIKTWKQKKPRRASKCPQKS